MHPVLKVALFLLVLGAGFGGVVFFLGDRGSAQQASTAPADAAQVATATPDAASDAANAEAIDAAADEPEIEITPNEAGSGGAIDPTGITDTTGGRTGATGGRSGGPTGGRTGASTGATGGRTNATGGRTGGATGATTGGGADGPTTSPGGTAGATPDAGRETIVPPTGPTNIPAGTGDDECDETSCVLANYDKPCCAKYKPATTTDLKPRTGDGLPETLDRAMVRAGVNGVKPKVVKCGEKIAAKGTVKIAMSVTPEGAVSDASVADAPDAALGECVAAAMKLARFGKSVNGGSFTYPFVF